MTVHQSPAVTAEGSRLLLEPIVQEPLGKTTMEAILRQRWKEMADLAGIIPTVVPMNPDIADAAALASDVAALERKVLPLIRDLADYAAHTLSVPRDEIEDEVNIIADAFSSLRGLIHGAR